MSTATIKKTKKAYEQFLNENYSDTVIDYYNALADFGHMASKEVVINHYNDHKLGTLLRKKQPVTFNCGYTYWQP